LNIIACHEAIKLIILPSHQAIVLTDSVDWYGILGFNVPLDTV